MKSSRSAPIALRFDSTTKAALALIADRKGRSMALMMEWLIRKHCDKESLSWPPAGIKPATPTKTAKYAKKPRKAASDKN